MSDFLTVVKDNALAITTLVGVFTIIGTGLGFWLNFRLSRKKIDSDKKALRQQMITNNIAPMRQEWISDLRESCADYLSDINFIIVFKTSDNEGFKNKIFDEYKKRMYDISKKSSYIDLLLPFKRDGNEEVEAENLRNDLSKINDFFDEKEEYTLSDMKEIIIDCRNSLKILLKKEWEVTKSLKEIE